MTLATSRTLSPDEIKAFFAWSSDLDRQVLRPLSHIASNWEATWSHEDKRYEPEVNSFADDLNAVIDMIAHCAPPANYHQHEDLLAESVLKNLKWPIEKKGGRWIGADYQSILEQGAFRDWGQLTLVSAACGRVVAAFRYEQRHVDEMEDRHRAILCALMAITIYHRYSEGTSLAQIAGDD